MASTSFLIVFLAIAATQCFAFTYEFSNDVHWVPYSSALATARSYRKPIFLLVYNSNCEECLKLKDEITDSPDHEQFVQLSKKFVMTTVADNEIQRPEDDEFSPDGRYTPRIVFLSPDGKRISSVTNTARHRNYLHFYDRLEDIIKGMKRVLAQY